MTLTRIMVTKHRKWYLKMSVTLSMPIYWLCLRSTSKLWSPMSPSPKSRTFRLWPDLWRHQWPLGQISTMFGKFTFRAIEWRLSFGNRSSSLGDHRGGDTPLPNRMCDSTEPNGARVIEDDSSWVWVRDKDIFSRRVTGRPSDEGARSLRNKQGKDPLSRTRRLE